MDPPWHLQRMYRYFCDVFENIRMRTLCVGMETTALSWNGWLGKEICDVSVVWNCHLPAPFKGLNNPSDIINLQARTRKRKAYRPWGKMKGFYVSGACTARAYWISVDSLWAMCINRSIIKMSKFTTCIYRLLKQISLHTYFIRSLHGKDIKMGRFVLFVITNRSQQQIRDWLFFT